MLRALWNSKTAMIANQNKLDSISNNISNSNTDGYKKLDVRFKDLVQDTFNRHGYPITENANRQVDPYSGGGSRETDALRVFTQGNIRETTVNTDLAIDGEGLFRLTRADGTEIYKRVGSFGIDIATGNLVDDMGNRLYIEYNQGINPEQLGLDRTNLSIDKSGTIYREEANSKVEIGRIPLYKAIGDKGFVSVGESSFIPAEDAQIVEAQDYDIRQGFIEMSNVDVAEEFTQLILTQRAFELSSKSLKTADEMWGMINNLKGR
ncbi:flagellar basal body rod protein FlgG [Clostridium sp. MSJ-4]|uniref:Flagellar basal body rod protein FlgG n=1 Tax=Clostridium simiarum TaxID=2841506 RepID=A0ABS6EXW1_9CLOT|nr:flagellar hook-basal body complex protein [Clostridium simiarum]MBU5591057.1 flagellar basal body rod protein FlgG [Clostridium simiarum]